MLDNKFTSDLRVAHFKNQNEAATFHIYDRELRDYSKIVPKLTPNDWKQFDIHFAEKSLGWKYRLANCLCFADFKSAFPLWLKLQETRNAKILSVLTADLRLRQSKGELENLTAEEADFVSYALKEYTPGVSSTTQSDLPERFRNKVYSQKHLDLDILFWRWKKWRSTYICCYASDNVVEQLAENLKAGIELAEHFGEAVRTYTAVQPTAMEMEKIGSAFFLKKISVAIFDEQRYPSRTSDYSINSQSCDITFNLALPAAIEMTATLIQRRKLWIEPPYIGWDLLPDVLSEQVFLLPALPDDSVAD